MDSDKKHIVQCDCQDEESGLRDCDEQQQQVERARKRESRCGGCLLTSLFLFLLAVIGLTALAITAKLFLDITGTKFNVHLPSISISNSDDVRASDAEQNAINDHVIEQAKHQIVFTFTDYKKRLEVVKAQNELSGRVVCYVTPLMDGRQEDDTRQREHITNTGTPEDITTSDTTTSAAPARRALYFVASDTPINDVTFLGQKVGGMCAGVETYWIIPTDSADTRDAQVLNSHAVVSHPDVIIHGRMRREAASQEWQYLVIRPQEQQQPQNIEIASSNFRMLERYSSGRSRAMKR